MWNCDSNVEKCGAEKSHVILCSLVRYHVVHDIVKLSEEYSVLKSKGCYRSLQYKRVLSFVYCMVLSIGFCQLYTVGIGLMGGDSPSSCALVAVTKLSRKAECSHNITVWIAQCQH